MNKKIRAVVKHYEKNMKFESKFEQLSHKLDLIKDDTPLKSDVIVIRRKLIPAYMMSILVMALVTGLIGLQIGLGNLKIKTEYINPVKLELEKHVDIYMDSAIQTEVLDKDSMVFMYYGLKNNEDRIIIYLKTDEIVGNITLEHNGEVYTYTIEGDGEWYSVPISSTDVIVDIEFTFEDVVGNVVNETISVEIGPIREFFFGDTN